MLTQRIRFLCFLAWLLPATVYAGFPDDEAGAARRTVESFSGACGMAETKDAQGQPVFFWQHVFDDGAHDLAMAETRQGGLTEIRRVTFGGGKQPGCHFPGLAIARGGDWGWHLAWVVADAAEGRPALRYVRMDGAAWVSSPAKRFGTDSARQPRLLSDGAALELQWQETIEGKSERRSVHSRDEGRNWE